MNSQGPSGVDRLSRPLRDVFQAFNIHDEGAQSYAVIAALYPICRALPATLAADASVRFAVNHINQLL
jgi:hypothetical protein